MLIIKSRVGEGFVILDEKELIDITILGLKGRDVNVGVKSSGKKKIYRKKVYLRIQNEKKCTVEENFSGLNDKVAFSINKSNGDPYHFLERLCLYINEIEVLTKADGNQKCSDQYLSVQFDCLQKMNDKMREIATLIYKNE